MQCFASTLRGGARDGLADERFALFIEPHVPASVAVPPLALFSPAMWFLAAAFRASALQVAVAAIEPCSEHGGRHWPVGDRESRSTTVVCSAPHTCSVSLYLIFPRVEVGIRNLKLQKTQW